MALTKEQIERVNNWLKSPEVQNDMDDFVNNLISKTPMKYTESPTGMTLQELTDSFKEITNKEK